MLVALAGGAGAHPHLGTDRQAMLSLGLARADIALAIVPGTGDGPALVARLDADGDGKVSAAEADAFAADLIAGLALSVDHADVALAASAGPDLPPLDALAAGEAGLRLKLSAEFALTPAADHQVIFTIAPGGLGEGWFIQPYLYPDFAAGTQAMQIERPAPGRLEMQFQTAGEGG